MHLIYRTVLLASLGLSPALNAGTPIGAVVTPGRILVNNLSIEGNATLFEGSLLKTTVSAARLDFSGGGAVSLDAASEAVAMPGVVRLSRGKGMLTGNLASIEAMGLKVAASSPQSQVLVAIKGDSFEVASLRGQARVHNARGFLLALVNSGKPLSFQPGVENSDRPQSSVTGTLHHQGSHYLVQDELTGANIELRGGNLSSHTGRRIQASGDTLIASDSPNHIILVSRLNRLENEPLPSPSTNSTSASTASKTAETGMSAGTKISLAALAFGGMAAAIVVPLAMSN